MNILTIISEFTRKIHPATLVVVTKTQPAQVIHQVIEAGATDIAESRLQEITVKYDEQLLKKLREKKVRLHFIGQLQSNKIAKIVKYCDMIQSVDALDKAEKVNQESAKLNKIMPILLQLNLTEESQKAGLLPSDLPSIIPKIQKLDDLQLKGFMTMGKAQDDDRTRVAFRRCKALAQQYQLPEVSMGMSSDYEIALEEGSTMLRIGSKIFQDLSEDPS